MRYILLSLLAITSCLPVKTSQPFEGSWFGEVIMVQVEYTFSGGMYMQKTYSLNFIQVGGTSGRYEVRGDTLYMTQNREYRFDNSTNRGAWFESSLNYSIQYRIRESQITFISSLVPDFEMVLNRITAEDEF